MDETKNTSLCVNSVVRRTQDGRDFRILWVECGGESFWIDITGESNVPSLFVYEDVENGISDGSYLLVVDKWLAWQDKSLLSEKALSHQERAWSLIKGMVECQPAVYRARERSQMLREKEKETGVKVNNLYRYLGKYWRGGMTADALYPSYHNCGKSTYYTIPGAQKPGRKQRPGATGKSLTMDDIAFFKAGIEEFYLTPIKPSLKEAYRDTLDKYYSKKDASGNRTDLSPEEIPSYFQFKHWYYSNRDPLESKRKREGQRVVELNNREILDKTVSYVFGPGDAVQIDATIGDFYLVRRDKRDAIAGRPTVYFVVDAVGSMVSGLHITFDPPSWNGALMAIMNCFEDKVEYCRRYGITITPEEWPCRFIPNRIIADRGEVEGKVADVLVKELGIAIDNTVPYRGDFKGIVEQHFHVVNTEIPKNIPGRIQKDFRTRGAHDYRLDAKMDIDQFTAIIILQTLFYNNHHWMETFVRTPELRARKVPSIPRDVWNHGLRYYTGAQRTMPREKLRFAVLPKGKGTITREGVRFNGLLYTSDRAEGEEWFARADITGAKDVTISYNPVDAAFIYVTDGSDFLEFHLVKYHEIYCRHHVAEVQAAQEDDKDMEAAHRIDEINASQRLNDAVQKIIDEAQQSAPDVINVSKAKRLADIQKNKSAERQTSVDVNTRMSLEVAGLLPAQDTQGKAEATAETTTPAKEDGQKRTDKPEPQDKATKENGKAYSPIDKLILESLEAELAEEEDEDD